MKAIQLREFGPAENFQVVEVPIPEPAAGEVLIKVEAAGIIFADTQMRRGEYVNLPQLPFIPGREVCGTVERVGDGVTTIRPGDRVTASMHTGGYAEYATAAVKHVVLIPDRVTYLQGVVYHINLRIAYLYYYAFGQIEPTATILLHAAAGGIGTLLTQIAKRRGKNIIIAVASSDEKLDYCRAHGADYGVNYMASDYVAEVLKITGGRGVDVSLNSVGGPTLKNDPLVLKPLGRWVINGYAAGKDLIDPYEVIMPKSLLVSIFSVYTVREREEYRRATEFMHHWLQTEELISVTKTFPLDEVIASHHWIEGQHSVGKIALVP